MAIADQGDVEALLQRSLTATELTWLPALLARADGLIAAELPGYRFTSVLTNQPVTLAGSGSSEIWLPGKPVTKVTSITLDGSLLDASAYDWHEYGDVARVDAVAVWPRRSSIAVVYDYGLPAPPEDVIGVAADMARWAITNPTGVRQESIGGGYAVTYEAARGIPGVALTDEHRRILRRGRIYPVPI